MKKFMLVPQYPSPSPLSRKLTKLDEEMTQILEKEDIGEYTKAAMYQNILSKYLDVRKQLAEPQVVPIIEKHVPTKNEHIINNIDLFPKQFQNKARHLLDHIEKEPTLSWNDKGEVEVRGHPISGSHIIDVVNDLVRPKRKNANSPRGIDEVVDVLKQSNVPMTLIGNKTHFNISEPPFDELDSLIASPPSSAVKTTGAKRRRSVQKWQNYN